jgi:hypothetical protein
MNTSIGLVKNPIAPNTSARPWPMFAAMTVARGRSMRRARRARRTRPPSIGNAGMRLNTPRVRFAMSNCCASGPVVTPTLVSGAEVPVAASDT